jgi:AcrR family transcriptional regulator
MDGSGSKREQNKQANRAALLEAARQCFLDQGYDAACIRDVVRRTELATGTFYNYFPDKESLFRGILEEHIADVNARMHEVHRNAPTAEAFIRGAYQALFRMIAEKPDFFGLLLRNEHTVRSLFKDTIVGLPMRALKDDIREAVARGIFPRIDVDLLAAAFYGIGFELGRLLVEQPGTDPQAAAEFATTLLAGGLKALAATDP